MRADHRKIKISVIPPRTQQYKQKYIEYLANLQILTCKKLLEGDPSRCSMH